MYDPGLKARRPSHHERFLSLRNVLGLQDEERKPSEVIAVEVRQQDNIDVGGLDLEPLHRDERGGAAVDEQALSVRLIGAPVDAGLEPPPLPKASPLPRNRTLTLPMPILPRAQSTSNRCQTRR